MTLAAEDEEDDFSPTVATARRPGVAAAKPVARVMRWAHVWGPCLIIVILAAPAVNFMLPATTDYLDEIYQPLQALKFFKTRGHAFHKYGPMPNFVLAPGYGASLLYWKVTGSFARPAENFPYGFKRPFEQMGFLIFQGRAIFLALGVVALAYLAHTLRLATQSRLAVGFALLFCVATNWALLHALPSPRPDSPMIAFTALALAVYVRILFLGMTLRRGIWFSIWVACAVSSKELAAPMFVLPYLGLIALMWREGDRQPGGADKATSAMVYCVATGVIVYALLNVVYAPGTWWQRMKFWMGGPGIDAEVWGGGGIKGRIIGTLACLLDNLGPGGVIVVMVAVIALLVARPRRWVLLALPAVSVYVFGLSRIQYPADRFYTIFALGLVPVVACGLSAMRLERVPALAAVTVLAIVNIWFATFAWHSLSGTFEEAAERHALSHVGKTETVSLLNTFPWNPGSTRLDYLGYKHDPRSIQQMAAQRTDLPQWLYTTEGKLKFIEDARSMPARAAMMKAESGFDAAQWAGIEQLGYRLDQTIVPATPVWFPFDWMPSVRQWKQRREVLVYRRNG